MTAAIVIVLVGPNVVHDAILHDIFRTWESERSRTKSLVVEWKQERFNTFTKRSEPACEMTLRLVNDPQSTRASLTVKNEKSSELLFDRNVYMLYESTKTAVRCQPKEGDLLPFLQRSFNHMVGFLDPSRAAEDWTVRLSKVDEHYIYFTVKPKKNQEYGFSNADVVVLRHDHDAIPKYLRRMVRVATQAEGMICDIQSWRVNPEDGPTKDEFKKPEDQPGWRVFDSPFDQPKK